MGRVGKLKTCILGFNLTQPLRQQEERGLQERGRQERGVIGHDGTRFKKLFVTNLGMALDFLYDV